MDFREVLQLAHDRALAEHPDLDPRVKEKEASARQEAAKKAAEAKRLASINVGSRSLGRAVSARRGSLEDTMRDVTALPRYQIDSGGCLLIQQSRKYFSSKVTR